MKGTILKQARKKRKLTLEEAAALCGITPQYLSELERGVKKNPSAKTLNKMVEVYKNREIINDFIDTN